MKRILRKPKFWVALIVASFTVNLLLAAITLHRHIRHPEGDVIHSHDGHPSSFFFSPRTTNDQTGINRKGTAAQPTPESVLWRRMLQQDLSATGPCGPRFVAEERKNSKNTTRNRSTGEQLRPFGFRWHIQQFVEPSSSSWPLLEQKEDRSLRGSSQDQNNTGTISTRREEKSASMTTTTATTCFLPPTTRTASSHEMRYSVVMYSRAKNLRRLLLNLMAFQSYPSVHDIILIVPSSSSSLFSVDEQQQRNHHYLEQDSKLYGSRILDWHSQGTIEIMKIGLKEQGRLQQQKSTTLWDSLAELRPKEAAILWVDGDRRKDWNGTTFKNNFHIWDQHSRALVVSASALLPHGRDDSSGMSSSFSSSSCPLNRLHGTLIHRNWLCFLQHPVLEPLRDFLANENFALPVAAADTLFEADDRNDWDTTLHALSILWNQLGEGHIVTGPPITPQQPDFSWIQSTTGTENTNSRHRRRETSTTNTNGSSTNRLRTILDYFGCPCSVVQQQQNLP